MNDRRPTSRAPRGAHLTHDGDRPTAEDTAAVVNRLLATFRAQLLAGRGPGAGDDELDRHMSYRPTVGGRSTAVLREMLHLRTARHRGSDPGVIDREREWARPWTEPGPARPD
jgi:hypothetical protein